MAVQSSGPHGGTRFGMSERAPHHRGLRRIALAVAGLLLPALAGCSTFVLPGNHPPELYGREQTTDSQPREHGFHKNTFMSDNMCPPAGTAGFIMPGGAGAGRQALNKQLTMRYSPGDRFNIFVPGAPEFSGDYVVNADGRVILPYTGEIVAVGMSNTELTTRIESGLVRAGLFASDNFKISVRPVQYAPINVTVAGAVFLPGRFVINNIAVADKGDKALSKFGDSPIERFVAAAMRAAGGVRPDADLANIVLLRKGVQHVLNWRGAMIGAPVDDVPLLEGDHIQVGLSPCFQSALVRPSQVTPPGIRLFLSNLTVPATSNANSGINRDAVSIPYGTRLLAGLVAANCVGGSRASNASRYGVLISRNPKTQDTEVIQRSVEELVLSPDRDTINPYLMPDDAIACYDSAVTDAREIGNSLQSLLQPGFTFRASKY